MAAGKNEPIAVGPIRMGRIVPAELGKKRPTKGGERHRRARMAGVRSLDRIHAQAANRLYGELIELRGVPHALSSWFAGRL
jgi:hypothetical protein